MATKMEWDWVKGVQVVVFTTYVDNNTYDVRIMLSETNIPNNPKTTPWAKPWKIVAGITCKSHAEAQDRTFKYVKNYIEKHGNPFKKEA